MQQQQAGRQDRLATDKLELNKRKNKHCKYEFRKKCYHHFTFFLALSNDTSSEDFSESEEQFPEHFFDIREYTQKSGKNKGAVK